MKIIIVSEYEYLFFDAHFLSFDFVYRDAKLIKMMGYLAPAYLRVGGNQADQIVFMRQNESSSIMKNGSNAYILLGKQIKL